MSSADFNLSTNLFGSYNSQQSQLNGSNSHAQCFSRFWQCLSSGTYLQVPPCCRWWWCIHRLIFGLPHVSCPHRPHSSADHSINAEVAQGLALSSLLYAAFIANIPKAPRTSVVIYVDDTAILVRSISAHSAIIYLQEAVDASEKWCRCWRITVNLDKSSALFITKFRQGPVERVSMLVQIWPDEAKYQSVINKKFSFISQIDYIVTKTNGIKGVLGPLIGRRSKMSIKNKLFYRTINTVSYASVAWSCEPSKTKFHRLEVLQTKILR